MTLIQRLILHEGLSLKPYKCPTGHLTIGYGHKILPTETFDTITEDEAMDILMTDVEIARMQLAKAFPWVLGLDDARLHVLYELCFWIGIGGVGKFKKMLACIRVQDWEGASKNLLDSLLYKQVPRRTKELAKILLEGQ